ncbi:MAG: cystathionine beta-synthase [Marinilabiliales bacterium]|nr:MAG: cystathionine beta-synthase [Marinilabiliales bacterium]
MSKIEALNLIGNTPMVHLKTLDPKPGVEIYAKLEFLNPTGSYKDRIIQYMVKKGVETGKINSNTTLVEGSSGNTGASVSMVASSMGLKSIIFVPDKCSDEKVAIIRSYGAEVIVIPTPESYEDAAANKAKEHENYYHINQYNSQLNPEAHYMTTGKEIWDDMNGNIDAFVATASTGGAISGIAKRLKENDPNIKIILADPEGSVYKPYFEGKEDYLSYKKPFKVEGAGKGAIVDAMNFKILDDAISFNDENAISMVHRLARQEGLMVGGSSGGNVWAALHIAKRMEAPAKIVTVVPDSGFKYMSKIFNPKWLNEVGLGHLAAD